MGAKTIFCMVIVLVITSFFVSALECQVPATVKVHFMNASGGNMGPRVYVGTTQLQFNDSEPIPLSQNGQFVVDAGYVENVPGIALQRQDGALRFLLFGGSRTIKEIVGAEIILENAKIVNFSNDNGRAVTSPKQLNKLENQGNGNYAWGGNNDEVFWSNGSSNATWYSAVYYDNDGFYLYIECDKEAIVCSSSSDCGVDGYVDAPVCSGDNVVRTYQSFTCNNPGTPQSTCSASNSTVIVETCSHGCSNGACIQPCNQNSDCGVDGFVSDPVCTGNNVTRIYQTFICNNPGTQQSSCSSSNSTLVIEECSYQCSNGVCQNYTQSQISCQYATSANATSENVAGSLAVYATGAPDAPQSGNCNTWSGYGYTWTPSNWNVKANLTLTYDTLVNASNITVTGDYDMCWDSVWLRNSKTGQEKLISSTYTTTCVTTINLAEDFQADQVILETCGWAWCATDAVEMCGKTTSTPPPVCSQNSDCGVDGFVSDPVCTGNNVTRIYQTFICNNPGTQQSSCSSSNSTLVIEECSYQCSNGTCTSPAICNSNSDCGVDGFVSDPFCSGNNVVRTYQTFTCSNPGTSQANCSASNSTVVIEQCLDGCSNGMCQNQTYIYVIPYIGDIDGFKNPEWFYFYHQLIDFHDANKINISFSFFPGAMSNHVNYTAAMKKMYLSNYTELIQKGYDGVQDWNIDQLPYEEQKALLKKGQDDFRANMSVILGIPESAVVMPITDDQEGAKFTEVTRQALEDLGFKSYLDFYLAPGLQPVQPADDFDVMQYGVSFTSTGGSGSDLDFRSKAEIINDIKTYNRTDVPITYINGHMVVPLYAHQQDFEGRVVPAQYDTAKWSIYTDTLLTLKNDPEIRLVTPKQVYELRHGPIQPPVTNCSSSSDCGVDGFVSDPVCTGNNVTRIYQTFICNNPGTQQSSCSSSNSTVVIEECSYSCSGGVCQNETNQTQTTLCQYATSANATSENVAGSLAVYATGAPDAPNGGDCAAFSGYGYDWSPSNWNVKATLTLTYDYPIYVSNLTVVGDYDMCWSSITLKNSQTGATKKVSNEVTSCVVKLNLAEDFQADQVILETCGWAWCATDAVEMCGSTNQTITPPPPPPPPENSTNVTVCKWKNCRKGAVSVSVDDEYNSCMDKLEANGFRGTYFLTNTKNYNIAKWSLFAEGFNKGHELGTHMQNHLCYEVSDSVFYDNIENNIVDIISHTNAKREDIVSHAYPCGVVGQNYPTLLSNNWNFISARGYFFNQLEDSTPKQWFNLKSFNTPHYHEPSLEPPNLLTVIDSAESQGKWANLVFHNECSDDGAINYLTSKNVWVDTIGNVARYIRLRDASEVYNYAEVDNEIRFNVRVNDNSMNASYYRQNLTMWVPVGSSQVSQVRVNNQAVPYSFGQGEPNYVVFDIPFPIGADIVVVKA